MTSAENLNWSKAQENMASGKCRKICNRAGLETGNLAADIKDGETQCNRGAVLSYIYELYFGLESQK